MELVNERMSAPLLVTGFIMFVFVLASYGLVHLMYQNQADINMFFWVMERAAGFTAYLILTASTVLGLTIKSRFWDKVHARYIVSQVHQFLALLFVSFIAAHLWGLSQDTTIPFSIGQFLVPFTSSYRATATGMGILAAYGVLILIVSSALRKHLGQKFWKGLHFIAFPVYILVTLHGFLAGTDSSQVWAHWIYGASLAVFALAFLARLTQGRTSSESPSASAPGAKARS